MNKLKSLTFTAALLTGTAMTLAPALAAPPPDRQPATRRSSYSAQAGRLPR